MSRNHPMLHLSTLWVCIELFFSIPVLGGRSLARNPNSAFSRFDIG